MRTAEEAWGLRWVRSGPSSTYAETSSLTVDGERRYGLVVVAYWRSGDGDVDRQSVLRMTAPVTGANQLRRVADYLRDVLRRAPTTTRRSAGNPLRAPRTPR